MKKYTSSSYKKLAPHIEKEKKNTSKIVRGLRGTKVKTFKTEKTTNYKEGTLDAKGTKTTEFYKKNGGYKKTTKKMSPMKITRKGY